MRKKTLIYIIGAGRSGTTLLDIVLGNNSNAISIGEYNRFFKRNGKPPKRIGSNEVSKFWNQLKSDFDNRNGNVNYEEYERIFRNNEYHSAAITSLLKRNKHKYTESLKLQYEALLNSVNEDIIIESSKYPLRALNISNYLKTPLIETKYVYLKKDPVKVVESFQKRDIEQPSKGFISANLYYLTVNLLCGYIFKILKRRKHKLAQVKYEELITNPIATIDQLSNELDVNFEETKNKVKNNSPLTTCFLFDGNRIRLKETLFLRSDDELVKKNFKFYLIRTFNFLVYR